MDKIIEIIKAVFSAPITTLLIVAGVGFLAIAVLGKIGNIPDPGKNGRLASGAIGTALLIVGLSILLNTDNVSKSPTPSPSPVGTANPAPPSPPSQNTTMPSPPLESNSCLQQFLQNIPRDRIVTIESGVQDAEIIPPDQPKDQPVALLLTDNGNPVSVIQFQFYSSNELFKIKSVIDAQCRLVEDYRNTTRGGDKNVLQNWDAWKVRLGTSTYTIRFGYGSDRIGLDVNRSSPTP